MLEVYDLDLLKNLSRGEHGNQFYLPNRKLFTPSFIPGGGVTLPQGEQFIVTHQFQASAYQALDWDFSFTAPWLLMELTGFDSDAAGFLIQIVHHRKRGGPFNLLHRPTPYQAVLGSGQRPAVLGEPHLFDAGESVTLDIRNLSAAATEAAPSNIFVALIGQNVSEASQSGEGA